MTTTSHLAVEPKILVIVQDAPSLEATLYQSVAVPSVEKSPACKRVHPAIGPAATVTTVLVTSHISIKSPSCTAAGAVGLFTTGEAVAVVKSVSPIALNATAISTFYNVLSNRICT